MGLDLLRRDGAPPKLVGHRGALAVAPENTMASFKRALADGADMAELDVCLCKDNHVVVIHDATVDRTTDGTGLVSEMTLAELKRLDAGSWFDPRYAGERIPTLAELLDWARGRLQLLLELKYHPLGAFDTDLVPAVIDLVQKHDMVDGAAFISYQPQAVAQAKHLLPALAGGPMPHKDRLLQAMVWLTRRFPSLAHISWIQRVLLRPLTYAQRWGGDIIAPNIAMVTPTLVDAAHAAGLPISSGGVAWDYPTAIAMGVDTVSANNPGLVRQTYLS